MNASIRKLPRILMTTLPAMLVMVLLAWLAPTEPESLVTSERILTSEHVDKNIEIVMALPERSWGQIPPGANALNTPFQRAHWLKVQLPTKSEAGDSQELIAEAKFIFFRDLEFFLVADGKLIDHHLTGSDHPESSQGSSGPFFQYKAALGPSTRLLYVRSFADVPNYPKISLRKPLDFQTIRDSRIRIMSVLAGISVFLILYNIAVLCTQPSKNSAYQLATQASFLTIVYFGLDYHKTVSANPGLMLSTWSKICSIAYVIGVIFLIRLIRDDIKLDRAFPRIIKKYRIIQLAHVVAALIVLTTPYTIGLATVYTVGIICVLWLVSDVYYFARFNSVIFSTSAHLSLICGLILSIATILGVIPDNTFSRLSGHLGVIWMSASYMVLNALVLRTMNVRQNKINRAMQSDASKTDLNSLLTPTYDEDEAVANADVSIMFVDIVHFTLLSAQRTTAEMFAELSHKMQDMIKIVESHGGSVDRSLGDGILCFFGHSDKKQNTDHAAAALLAAEEIQKLTTKLELVADQRLVLPVRIGIHSSRVLIGNLGDSKHLDFTMIGSGVNFASRLETACSPFKIMISAATLDLLLQQGFKRDRFTQVAVAIKHQRALTSAFEYNPFRESASELTNAEKKFLKQINLKREENRLELRSRASIVLESAMGRFEVLDFSIHGFRATATTMIGRRALIPVKIITSSEQVNQELPRHLMQGLIVEVRWSQEANGGFAHGLKIFGGSEDRKRFLFELFRSHLGNASTEQADQAWDTDKLTATVA